MKPRSPGARFVSPVSKLNGPNVLPRGPVIAGRPMPTFTSAVAAWPVLFYNPIANIT
jgi:hypothetical protein